jgi:hypothetical protein
MKTRTKKRRKRRKTKTRTGSSIGIGLAVLLLAVFPGAAESKRKSASPAAPFALIAGTSFRPPGLSLPGAKVTIKPDAPVGDLKLKPAQADTDSRGEFAFRVPAVPMRWTVYVERKGYRPETRTVQVEGEQRVDLSILLEPDGGKSTGGKK